MSQAKNGSYKCPFRRNGGLGTEKAELTRRDTSIAADQRRVRIHFGSTQSRLSFTFVLATRREACDKAGNHAGGSIH